MSVSKVHRFPSWVNSPPTMSKRISPGEESFVPAGTKRKRAPGSTKRRISHAYAIRSIWMPDRVTQIRPTSSERASVAVARSPEGGATRAASE
jgi:hypothetical protein